VENRDITYTLTIGGAVAREGLTEAQAIGALRESRSEHADERTIAGPKGETLGLCDCCEARLGEADDLDPALWTCVVCGGPR
jgi:hypothetical protein